LLFVGSGFDKHFASDLRCKSVYWKEW